MATLRSYSDEVMARLSQRCCELAAGIAAAHGLDVDCIWSEEFPATVNDPAVVAVADAAAAAEGLSRVHPATPFAWSEDFGHFTAAVPGALVGLGAGAEQPSLHHPRYDFPDALLPTGVGFWRRALDLLLAQPIWKGDSS
jgi:metal-dependent amidase/aminoacylase/carboxypeptidase family protein